MVNPFNTKYPVKPELFANRKREIEKFSRDLKRTVESGLPENIAILGDWGVGKSSLANKFLDIATRTNEKILGSQTSVPRTIKNIEEFYFLLLHCLRRDLILKGILSARIRERLRSWRITEIDIGPLTVEKDVRAQGIPITQFHSELIDLWKKYLAPARIKAVVIVIDDIQYLMRSVEGGVLDIRSIFQDLPRHGCNYQLVITGPRTLFNSIRELAEPMGRFFNTYEIREFSLEETKELVRDPIKAMGLNIVVRNEVIEHIFRKTLGNPYFICFIMQKLIEKRTEGVIDHRFFNQEIKEIIAELEREKFTRDIAIASGYERKVLHEMARMKESVFFSELHLVFEKPKVSVALKRLVEKNIVIRTERGRYRLYHPLFREYLRNHE